MSAQMMLDDRSVVRFAPMANEPGEAAGSSDRQTLDITIYDDLGAVEDEWRRFEQVADCTAFQSFTWLSIWQRNVGRRRGIRPAIVCGRCGEGELMFVLPLAIELGPVRKLTFFGSDMCDYNAPLLAPNFADHVKDFAGLWVDVCGRLQRAGFAFDVVELAKMPEIVGSQANPFLALDVGLNPSGAHLTHLKETWEEFYQAARSSATRRRDRSKRKRLGEFGEVRFVNPQGSAEAARVLDILIEQKSKALAHMGVPNIFAPAGHRQFYLDLATDPRARNLVHVSHLDVGALVASTNLGLTFRGCYYYVLASYDDGEVSRFGPGAAHLRDLIGYAIGHGLRVFDFTVGDEGYKREWADTTLKLYDYVAAASLRGWPWAALTLTRRRLKRAIKQSPMLWRLITRVRGAIGAMRSRISS